MKIEVVDIDDKIVQKFSKGDEKSFQFIYEQNVVMLRYFAAKFVDDQDAVEDVIQEAFIKLWENRKGFANYVAIKTFLFKIVRNICLNNLRHNKVKKRYESQALQNPDSSTLFEQIIDSETFDLIFKVFNELSPACRMVYKLSLDGKKHEEIASILNISINTIKKHKNNANHYMRKRLNELILIFIFFTLV